MNKIVRIATIALSLDVLLKGQLNFLNNFFHVIAVSSDGNRLKKVGFREKVSVFEIPFKRSISLFHDICALFYLFFFFLKEKPVLVHSITPKAGLLAMVAGKLAGVPIRIHTFTGLVFPSRSGFLRKILIVMDKLLCYCATNVYPEGNGVKNDLQSFKITKKPLNIIANGNVNGVDINFFHPLFFNKSQKLKFKEKFNISSIDFVFVFVGRIVKEKGISELVLAFEEFNKCNSNSKLFLVGDFEPSLDPINQDIQEKIVSNSSIFPVGFQDDIRPFLSISDCLVLPSYREGFPNVVLQACSMGVPCIVSDVNGSNEIIVNGENGIIVPSRSSQGLLNAFNKIFFNKSFYFILKSKARNSIVEKFNQKYVWECTLKEYRTLLENIS